MSTQTSSTPKNLAPIGPMLWLQTRTEVLRLWRTPSFLGPTVILPLVLYTIIGGLSGGHDRQVTGVDAHVYALASVATYSIVSIMLFSFGVNIANERAQRVTALMRATPLPTALYLLAKVFSALLSALVMLLLLGGFAILVGGAQLSITAWGCLIAALVLGVLPFIGLGFALGIVINPTGAAPIINLSFFVLAFASGIFVPLSQLPDVVQNLAPYSPFYQLAQLAWSAIGVATPAGTITQAIWLLILYAAIFFVLALYASRQEEKHSFG